MFNILSESADQDDEDESESTLNAKRYPLHEAVNKGLHSIAKPKMEALKSKREKKIRRKAELGDDIKKAGEMYEAKITASKSIVDDLRTSTEGSGTLHQMHQHRLDLIERFQSLLT